MTRNIVIRVIQIGLPRYTNSGKKLPPKKVKQVYKQ